MQWLALNAIAFPKTKSLEQSVGDLSGFQHSTRQRKLPVVLTRLGMAPEHIFFIDP